MVRKMERAVAINTIEANVKNENLFKHMLATEAVMRALARCFEEDEEEWGITGLLHDIDVELTEDNPHSHSTLGADMARTIGASEKVAHAIHHHNGAHGIPCETLLDKALFCTDPLTGLITAAALIRPEKSLSAVSVDSLKKRFREKRFAAGVSRGQIASCSEIGLELDEFIMIGLEAMRGIAAELGM